MNPICVRGTYDPNDSLKAENRDHLEGRVQITNIIADHIGTSLDHISLIYDRTSFNRNLILLPLLINLSNAEVLQADK